MGKQTFDRTKKTLTILLLVFFIASLTAALAAADIWSDTKNGAEQGGQDFGKQASNEYHKDILQQGSEPLFEHANDQASTEAEKIGQGQEDRFNTSPVDVSVGPVSVSVGPPSGETSSTGDGTSTKDNDGGNQPQSFQRLQWIGDNGVWYNKHSSGEWHEFKSLEQPKFLGAFQETGRDDNYVYLRSANGNEVALTSNMLYFRANGQSEWSSSIQGHWKV